MSGEKGIGEPADGAGTAPRESGDAGGREEPAKSSLEKSDLTVSDKNVSEKDGPDDEKKPGGWEGFRRSSYGMTFAVGLAVAIDILLILFPTCLTGALLAVVTFGLPYYFGMKRPRDLLVMGTAVILFLSVFSPVFIHVTNLPKPTTPMDGGDVMNLTASHVAASYDERVNITCYVNQTDGWIIESVHLRIEGLTHWLQLFWPDTSSTEGNYTMSRGGDFAYDRASKEWKRAAYDGAADAWTFADTGENASGRVATLFYFDRAMGTGDYQFSVLAAHRNDTANVTLYSVASVAEDESVFIYKLVPWFLLTYLVSTFIDASLFYILVGMSWWMRRTKELAGGMVDSPRKSGAPKPEFTCSDCGGDVYASETTCPHCGARLED